MRHLTGFNGLRGIACLAVIVHHLSLKIDLAWQERPVRDLVRFGIHGNIGVSVFFVLSGALLSLPFWTCWYENRPFPSLRSYALRRFARIAPGYYLSMWASLVVALWLFPVKLDALLILRFVAGLLFVNSWHYVTFFPVEVNTPLWSIGFEIVSYVLMIPFLFAMFKLIKGNRKLAHGFCFWLVSIGLIALIHIAILNIVSIPRSGRGWSYGLIGGAKFWMPKYNPVGFYAHFCVGVLASSFIVCRFSAQQKTSALFDLIAVALLIVGVNYVWIHRTNQQADEGMIMNLYFWPWFPLVIAGLLMTLPFSKYLGKLIDNPLLTFTAKISFGLYIWHFLVMEVLRKLWFPKFSYLGAKSFSDWYLPSLLSLIVSFVIASLSWYLVERRFVMIAKRATK